MTNVPKVSVAVVTYNQCELLRECLDAILAQDHPNVEIVIADDASPDGTKALIADYKARHGDKIVPVLAKVNGGVTANQQAALMACTGKYIAWMAGDDLMLPGKLSTQVAHMESNPDCAVVYHDLEMFEHETGKSLGLNSDVDKPRNGDVSTLVRYGMFNGATSNMVRASCSPAHGFYPQIPTASDWIYYVECLGNGGRIEYIDKVLGKYRRHGGNVTSGDERNPRMHLIADHFMSCQKILMDNPHLAADVKYRTGYLLLYPRFRNGGRQYNDYVRASLRYRFRLKALLGLAASLLFKIKR